MAKAKATHCAYCWASGLIQFGEIGTAPKAAIEFARGPEAALKETVAAVAREGQGASEGKLLVPGLPEAPNQHAGIDALESFVAWCGRVLRVNGVTFGIKVRL